MSDSTNAASPSLPPMIQTANAGTSARRHIRASESRKLITPLRGSPGLPKNEIFGTFRPRIEMLGIDSIGYDGNTIMLDLRIEFVQVVSLRRRNSEQYISVEEHVEFKPVAYPISFRCLLAQS